MSTSKWNQRLLELDTYLKTTMGLTTIDSFDDIKTLVGILKGRYHDKSRDIGRLISPENLEQMASMALEIYAIRNPCFKRELRSNIRNYCDQLYLHNDELQVKSAPVVQIPILMAIAKRLWSAPLTNRRQAQYKKRAAATALAICCFTGNRWIDTMRLKWNDIQMSLNDEKDLIFVLFGMRITKTSNTGKKPIWCSMYQNKVDGLCPFVLLQRWWVFTGRKQQGFLFPKGSTHADGTILFYQIQCEADAMNLPLRPTKHTPRNTLVATLFSMGVSLEEIRRRFNWCTHSEMPFRYVKHRLDKLPTAVSFSLAHEAQHNAFSVQDDFVF